MSEAKGWIARLEEDSARAGYRAVELRVQFSNWRVGMAEGEVQWLSEAARARHGFLRAWADELSAMAGKLRRAADDETGGRRAEMGVSPA